MDNTIIDNTHDGSNIILNDEYVLWCHDLANPDWSLKSYKKLCTIRTVSDFWRLFNNFKKIGWKYMHFYLMKQNITPMWEDINNRNGGICSFKMDIDNTIDIWETLNVHMICGVLTSHKDDINGLSISPKNQSWAIVKIWNKNNNSDFISTLNKEIIEKYGSYSIQYKSHSPEY